MDSSSHLQTRPSLLARLRNHADAEAWQLFMDLYTPLVYGFCRRRGLQEADAADVTQEVMTQVLRSVGDFTYDPSRGRFRDWLWAVTRTHWGRWHRTQNRQLLGTSDQLDDLAHAESDSEWQTALQEQLTRVALDRVQREVSSPHWEAFLRTWQDDRPAATVAMELGLSVTAVYLAKSRVLARLRDEMIHLADELPFAADG